jgi:type IV secretion system protein VirB5
MEPSNPKQKYLERYGHVIVMNNYLKVALLALSAVVLGLLAVSTWAIVWASEKKPLIIRIDEVGRATPINYSEFAYKPEAPEIRYFLAQFVQLHFTRLVPTVKECFGKSLFFLDAKLSEAVIEEERTTQSLSKFLSEGAEETDIEIRNIVLQDLRSNPMRASVDFERIYYQRGQRREIRREAFTASFEFIVQGSVPNSFVLVNPLGLIITYFRVDAAFKR